MSSLNLLSSSIADVFEDFLINKGISIPCEDEHEEEDRVSSIEYDDNFCAIYGSEYYGIIDKIESIISDHDRRNNVIIHNLLQDIYDKIFDCNYDKFHSYITLEIGITEDEINYLKDNNLYVTQD